MVQVARIPGTRANRLPLSATASRTLVAGWSTNLQSSFGVTNDLRTRISRCVGDLVATYPLLNQHQ